MSQWNRVGTYAEEHESRHATICAWQVEGAWSFLAWVVDPNLESGWRALFPFELTAALARARAERWLAEHPRPV